MALFRVAAAPPRILARAAAALLRLRCRSPNSGERPEPREAASLTGRTCRRVSADQLWPADRWWESYGDPQLAS